MPITVATNSTFTVTVVAVDSAGNRSLPAAILLKVRDTLMPVVDVAVAEGHVEIAQGSTFTAAVSASDNVGVTRLALRTAGALTTGQEVPVEPVLMTAAYTFTVQVPPQLARQCRCAAWRGA